MKTSVLTLADLQAARVRLAGSVRRTPCHPAKGIRGLMGPELWLKRDDLQRTGSFKERGARNALLCLADRARASGVVAASAGNHALGLAYHGATLGIKVTVVMPVSAPAVKVQRCRGLGAEVLLNGATFDHAQAYAHELARATGASYVHPFDDLSVIAGQATLALEVLEQTPDLDTLVVPVGGGGLLAGAALAVKTLRPAVRVIAVEPENAACFLAACVSGRRATVPVFPTLADGLAVARVGERTLDLASSRVDDVVTVNEAELAQAIHGLACHEGIVAEGAGAAATAAVLAGKVTGRRLVAIVGGRNIDARLHEHVVAGDSMFGSSSAAKAA